LVERVLAKHEVVGSKPITRSSFPDSMNRQSSDNRYPDISDILARKAEGRKKLAALSFGEKLEILEKLRAQVEPIRKARDARRARVSSAPTV
jgi:hypothetical protein